MSGDDLNRAQVADRGLADLRAALAEIDEVPLVDRVALFERANDVVAEHLAELDEV